MADVQSLKRDLAKKHDEVETARKALGEAETKARKDPNLRTKTQQVQAVELERDYLVTLEQEEMQIKQQIGRIEQEADEAKRRVAR